MKRPGPAPESNPDRFRCWMGLFPGYGCERLFPIRTYNPKIDLCLDCSNRIASQWGIAFDDLSMLFSAISLLQGYSFPAPNPATREQIYKVLDQLKVKYRNVHVYKPQQSQMPVNDREETVPW